MPSAGLVLFLVIAARTAPPAASPGTAGDGAWAGAPQSAFQLPSAATAVSPLAQMLSDGEGHLRAGDPESARVVLERAATSGPWTHDELVRVWRLLATARAFVGDAAGAQHAFARLLAMEPGAVVAYTASPKVTFAFEKARNAAMAKRAIDITMQLPAISRFDEPIEGAVQVLHDGERAITDLVVLHRLKGRDTWQRTEIAVPKDGSAVVFTLPPVARDAVVMPADNPPSAGAVVSAPTDADAPGVLIDLAVSGLDAYGSEVWRGPTVERPRELPVGFDAPPPWWASPWLWAGVSTGAALVAGAAAAGVVWGLTPPPTVPLTIEVNP